jgi:hypothetical protein
MENVIEPSSENLLRELKKRAKGELINTEDAYEELVDDLIAEKIEWGELHEEDDTQGLREDLIGRWPDVKEFVYRSETETP